MTSQRSIPQWISRLEKRTRAAIALSVLLILAAAIWALTPERHLVTVAGLEQPVTFKTTAKQLDTALKEQGIEPGPNDRVEPALSTSLKGKHEVTVQIHKAVDLSLVVGGEAKQVASAAESVKALLEEQQVQLAPQDAVSPSLDDALTAGMEIRVTRRASEERRMEQEIPFETVRREDSSLTLGESRVVQQGVSGALEIRRRVVLEDGKPVSDEVVDETVLREPVPEVVAYGTTGVVSRGGNTYRYGREVNMTATGYTAGKESNPDGTGHTYTGIYATHGVVAVDPSVIPLYTRLYIEGYGPAIAADIGGDIKGNRIDLCFDSLDEALNWGVRPVTVYVLTD